MSGYPEIIQKIINTFAKLPSVGPRTAERIVLYLLQQPDNLLKTLSQDLINLNAQLTRCELCRNFTEKSPCSICQGKNRDKNILCIVSGHSELQAIEKTGHYHGLYFILDGCLEPIKNQGPEEIKIPQLINRINSAKPKFNEIILAFNPDMSGETTALYLKKILSPLNITLTKLARGLPIGADLEYTDDITLTEALDNRQKIK